MENKYNNKVYTYRVRNFDERTYVVEKYTMNVEDEMLFYTKNEINYYISYRSYLRDKQEFINIIKEKENYNVGNLEEFNFYLATHYYYQNKEFNKKSITELNTLALKFFEDYNSLIADNKDETIELNSEEVQKYLGNKIKDIECIECMNVGQANFSIGYDKEEHACAIFDIGIRSSNVANANKNYAINKIKSIDDDGVVVISHYDIDHINGFRFLNNNAKNRIWILPERRLSPTPIERNLLSFLNSAKCIFLKNIDYSMTSFNSCRHVLKIGNISIYRGNAKKIDSFQSTDENARSLICLIKKEKSILFPADCLYEEFPKGFDVDYLAVPHHCCYYDKNITKINLELLKKLIVFAGPHNGYKHPDIYHLKLLNAGCLSPINTIFLTNHNNAYFCGKSKIIYDGFAITKPSYIIRL